MPPLRFEQLESRRLLAALQVAPAGGLEVIVEQGSRIVEVAPGGEVEVLVFVTESEEGIAGYQLNFGNSATDLVLRDYIRPFDFGAISDKVIDSANDDYFVLGASFTLYDVPPDLFIGEFTVVVPETVGDYLLTAESSDDEASRNTLLVGDNPISITDFGDLVLRVVPEASAASYAISSSAASVSEGQDATTSVAFTVTRSGSTAGSSTIQYLASGMGTNPANSADFSEGAFPSGVVAFADGESEKTVIVEVSGDGFLEADESFQLELSQPSEGGMITTGVAAVTIINDDSLSNSVVLVPSELAGSIQVPTSLNSDGLLTSIIFSADQTSVIRISEPNDVSIAAHSIIVNSNLEVVSQETARGVEATLDQDQVYALIAFPAASARSIEVTEVSGAFTVGADTNFLQTTDANGDGETTALDALIIINFLALQGASGGSAIPGPFLDVSQSGGVTALDALQVINRLPTVNVPEEEGAVDSEAEISMRPPATMVKASMVKATMVTAIEVTATVPIGMKASEHEKEDEEANIPSIQIVDPSDNLPDVSRNSRDLEDGESDLVSQIPSANGLVTVDQVFAELGDFLL